MGLFRHLPLQYLIKYWLRTTAFFLISSLTFYQLANPAAAQETSLNTSGLKNRITPYLKYGGTVEVEYELKKDFDLDATADDRQASIEPNASLALAYQPRNNSLFYAEFKLQRLWFLDRPPTTADGKLELEIQQLYLALANPDGSLTVTMGRVNYDDELEWIYDEKLDGVRLAFSLDKNRFLELSATRRELLFPLDVQDPRSDERVDNYIAKFRHRFDKDNFLDAYVFLRNDQDTRRPEDLNFFGMQMVREHDGVFLKDDKLKYWTNAAYVRGRERGNTISAYGFDAMATYVFAHELEPSVTFGFAFGSGDESLRDGKDGNFRQTGLQDNNASFNGVTSFKYYGEVFEPELSNILIYTAGIGIRPTKNSSIDVVYHRYLQHAAEDDIRDSNLEIDPNGESRQLGDEVDLIIGYRPTDNIRLEAVVGAFFPGSAFGPGADTAYFASTQFRFRF